MEPIIPPVERALLRAELTPERKLRGTNKADNEIYLFPAAEAPALMREVGRLREEAFRAGGGGTGCALDIDDEDLAPDGYWQLVVWDPAAQEIVGGYRFIVCTSEHPRHLSTEHYFRFSDRFRRDYLPHTIELGRSFVQVSYQVRQNPKSLYALDNLWDGLGALLVLSPGTRYLFGKVTMYASYRREARDLLLGFLHRHFPDPDELVRAIRPLEWNGSEAPEAAGYAQEYRALSRRIRELGETIPPMINAYMNLSPTMKVFDTCINPDFGGVEETGILITVGDVYPEKRERHTLWEGWDHNLEARRRAFRRRIEEHLAAAPAAEPSGV